MHTKKLELRYSEGELQMFNVNTYAKNLHIHFEDKKTIIKMTAISAFVIALAATAVFGTDYVVTTIMTYYM